MHVLWRGARAKPYVKQRDIQIQTCMYVCMYVMRYALFMRWIGSSGTGTLSKPAAAGYICNARQVRTPTPFTVKGTTKG